MKMFGRKKKKSVPQSLSQEERMQKKNLAKNAATYAMFASNTQPQSTSMGINGKGGGFDISNAQKVAAFNLLMNDKD